MYLEECNKSLSEYFPDNWEQQFASSTESDVEQTNNILADLTAHLSKSAKIFFKSLNLSVLSGEYISISDFEDYIKKIEKTLTLISEIDEGLVPIQYRGNFQDLLYIGFTKPLVQAINNYLGHYKKIKRKYNNPDRQSLFEAISKKNLHIPENHPNWTYTLLGEFINFTLRLSYIDHVLVVRAKQLEDLILIYHNLEERKKKNPDDIIVILLFDKCSFLLKKLLIRFDRDPGNYYYALDFEDKIIDQERFSPGNFEVFNQATKIQYVDSKLERTYHQFKENSKNFIKDWKNSKKLSFEGYHSIVKYHKEFNNTSIEKLTEIIAKFKTSHSSDNSFDEWASNVSYIYLNNNLLSFRLKQNNLSIRKIEEVFNETLILQSDLEIKNYFPFLKICKALLNIAEKELNKLPDSHINIDKIIKLIGKVEKEMLLCFEWCSDHHFIPFQLPFHECTKTVTIKDNSYSLFLASSFILPINFEKVNRELEEVQRNIKDYKSKYDIHVSIREEKEEIKNIKEAIQKTDKRHIEILSIFAAIVLFVSSNIQVFSKAETFIDALRFMLVFAYILILFVVVIWFITREQGFKIRKMPFVHWFFIGLLSLSTIGALYMIYPDLKINKERKQKTEVTPNNFNTSTEYKVSKEFLFPSDK